MSTIIENPPKQQLVFRATNTQSGRNITVTPENSLMKQLHYGRIILDAQTPSVAFDTNERETGLVCMSGTATVTMNGDTYPMGRYDAIYAPPGCSITVDGSSGADLAEFGAPVTGTYPVQAVSYEKNVLPDPTLHFHAGANGNARTLNILIGKNVNAGRIVAGVTWSEPGNWTSWPPHEHKEMLEEMYVYYDMPAPSFAVQFVYENPDSPDEHAIVVRDGDAVLMPGGYHPNVAIPGYTVSFLWIMAAHRETLDRQFGVVNVQPGFEAKGSGLEASRK